MKRSLASVVLLTTILGMGVGQAHNTPQEIANKKLVRDFYKALEDRSPGTTEKYIAVDYIQHQEGGKQGRAGMLEDARANSAAGLAPPTDRASLVAIIAEGDRVIQVTSRIRPDPATGGSKTVYIWNMFRIEKGMLAEHWDSVNPADFAQPPAAPNR